MVPLGLMPSELHLSIREDWKFCLPKTCWRGTYDPSELLVIAPGDCPGASYLVVFLLNQQVSDELLSGWKKYLVSDFVRFMFGAWWTARHYKRVRNNDWEHIPHLLDLEYVECHEELLQMPEHLRQMMAKHLNMWDKQTPAERVVVRQRAEKRKVIMPKPWKPKNVLP